MRHIDSLRHWISALLVLLVPGGFAGVGAFAELPDDLTVSVRAEGRNRELHLHKYSIRARDFRVRLWYPERGYTTPRSPEVATYRGTVTGEPNTRVCAVIKPQTGLTVYAHAGKTPIWRVTDEPLPDQPAGDPAESPVSDDEGAVDVFSAGTAQQLYSDVATVQPSGLLPPAGPIRRAQMALDVANEHLMTKYLGDWTEALADLEFTVNRYDDFMVRDVKMSVELADVVVRMGQFYDYEGSPLRQTRDHWSVEQKNLNWDFAGLFITPKNWPNFSYGGVAYLPGKYFVNVLFHENGHNLSAIHHLYGMDCMNGNRNAHWAALNAERIVDRTNRWRVRFTDVDADQYAEPVHPYAAPDLASTLVNRPIDIDALANDWDSNDDPIFIQSFSETTVPGGEVALIEGKLHYTPPQDYVGKDLIIYTIEDATGLRNTDLVRIEVINEALAAHWQFEEIDPSRARFPAGNRAFDASGNGHSALLPEGCESIPGVLGKAVRISADSSILCDDRSILPPPPEHWAKPLWHSYPLEKQASNFFDPMDASFALMFWFTAADFGTTEEPTILLSKANKADLGYSITADADGIYFKIRQWGGLYKTQTLSWTNAMIPRTWYHVTMVIDRDDDTVTASVDGRRASEAITLTPGSFICAGRTDLTMGGTTEVAFDEVYIYTRALTARDLNRGL